MDKKTYVLKALDLLKDSWDLAEWLQYLVEAKDCDEKVLDILIKIIQGAITKTDDEITKSKLQKANDFFVQLKQTEEKQKEIDQIDIASLEQIISTF